jgi:hypothetical protein
MFDQPPPKHLDTTIPIKGISVCAVGMGLGFGLCGVSAIFGSSLVTIGYGAFLLSLLGMFICIIWLIVAAIVNSFRGRGSSSGEEKAE